MHPRSKHETYERAGLLAYFVFLTRVMTFSDRHRGCSVMTACCCCVDVGMGVGVSFVRDPTVFLNVLNLLGGTLSFVQHQHGLRSNHTRSQSVPSNRLLLSVYLRRIYCVIRTCCVLTTLLCRTGLPFDELMPLMSPCYE